MKLTPDNLDYPDSGNPGRETGVRPSPRIEALIEKRKAERAGFHKGVPLEVATIAAGNDPLTMADRLIVALDVPTVADARDLIARLGGGVRFYKVGMWLLFDPGVHSLIDDLVAAGNQVFLDTKMYDIPETVRRGVAAVASRGVRIVTVHGDPDIVAAAVDGARGTGLLVFAITVLTSQDDTALAAMGYGMTVPELVALRVRAAAQAGAAGLIASAADDPDALRTLAGAPMLVATPGIRLPGAAADDQKRVATPEAAIARGADYLVVGRPITRAADPALAARDVLASMQRGKAQRAANTTTPVA